MGSGRTKLFIGMAALFLAASSFVEGTVFLKKQVVHAETVQESSKDRGDYHFSSGIIDEAKQTISWEIRLDKHASIGTVNRQLFLEISELQGVTHPVLTTEVGEVLERNQRGAYVVGEDDSNANSYRLRLTSTLLKNGEVSLRVIPKILETVRTLNLDEVIAKPTVEEAWTTTSEEVVLAKEEGSLLKMEIPFEEERTIADEPVQVIEAHQEEIKVRQTEAPMQTEVIKEAANRSDLKKHIEDMSVTEVRITGDIESSGFATNISINHDIRIVGWNNSNKEIRNIIPAFLAGRIKFDIAQDVSVTFDHIRFNLFRDGGSDKVISGAGKLILNNIEITGESGTGVRQVFGYELPEVTIENSLIVSGSKTAVFSNSTDINLYGNNTIVCYGDSETVFNGIRGRVLFEDAAISVANGGGAGGDHHIFYNPLRDSTDFIVAFKGSNSVSMNQPRTAFVGSNNNEQTPLKIVMGSEDSLHVTLEQGTFADFRNGEITGGKWTVTQRGGTFTRGIDTTIINDAALKLSIEKTDAAMFFFATKHLLIQNNATIIQGKGHTFRFYYTISGGSSMKVQDSTLELNGEGSEVTDFEQHIPAFIDFDNNLQTHDQQNSTLEFSNAKVSLTGKSYSPGRDYYKSLLFMYGLVAIRQRDSAFIVTNQSDVYLNNDVGTTVFMRGTANKFEINGGSEFTVESGSAIDVGLLSGSLETAHNYFPAIRLYGYNDGTQYSKDCLGHYQLNVDNATFNIVKKRGNLKSAALRLGGIGNQVNVENGGKLAILHEGLGNNEGIDPVGEGDLIAVQYDHIQRGAAGQASFRVGQGSTVSVDAKGGAAINAGMGKYGDPDLTIEVSAEKDATFIARGKTDKAGIFNADANSNEGILTFVLEEPKAFEFENYNENGKLLSANNSVSVFDAKQTFISLWKQGSAHEQDPTHIVAKGNYRLTGENFESSQVEQFKNGLNVYSYMRSHGEVIPKVEKVYQPTNADKHFFAKLLVPKRDSQGNVIVEDNKILYTETDNGQNLGALIIDHSNSAGQVTRKIVSSDFTETDSPEWKPKDANVMLRLDEWLTAGTQIELVGSWYKGMDGLDVPPSTSEELEKYALVDVPESIGRVHSVEDVLAPEITTDTPEVDDLTEVMISGTIESGAELSFYQEKTFTPIIPKALMIADGKWEATLDLSNGNNIFVYAKDGTVFDSTTIYDNGPKGTFLGQSDMPVFAQGNRTMDFSTVASYHDKSQLPTAIEIKVSHLNVEPVLTFEDDKTVKVQALDDYQDLLLGLKASDADSGDYIAKLEIKFENAVIYTQSFNESDKTWSDGTYKLTKELLEAKGVFATMDEKKLNVQVFSTNDSGSYQPSNAIELTLQLKGVLKLISMPELDYGRHSLEALTNDYILPDRSSNKDIIVRNSINSKDWTVQVSNRPLLTNMPSYLSPLAYSDGGKKEHLDGRTVQLFGFSDQLEKVAGSTYSFTTNWTNQQGIFFKMSTDLSAAAYEGVVTVELMNGL